MRYSTTDTITEKSINSTEFERLLESYVFNHGSSY